MMMNGSFKAEADMVDRHQFPYSSAKNPACDVCREKKVRCGREKPICRNCDMSRVACTYSERQKRDNEATRTGQKFDEVHQRLDRIEGSMQRLMKVIENMAGINKSTPESSHMNGPDGHGDVPIGRSPQSVSVRPINAPATNAIPKPLVKDEKGQLHFFGANALISITSEAERITEEAIKGGPLAQAPEECQTDTIKALQGLSDIRDNVHSQVIPAETLDTLVGLRKLGKGWWLPEKREEAIRICTVYFDGGNKVFPYFMRDVFFERLNKWYDNPDDSDDRGWLVCFNNVLLFGCHSLERKNVGSTEYKGLIDKFFQNIWIACDDISLFVSPRLTNVQALMTTAVVAQEISRPGLCWVLLSSACSLAQAIGLHRRSDPSQFKNQSEYEERKWVFWNLYLLDKTLSLMFGRSMCLPDFDIDVEYPSHKTEAYWFLFTGWLWLSKIKSKIYTRLYSASAAQLTNEEQQATITELDQELRLWWAEKAVILLNTEKSTNWDKIALEVQVIFTYHNTLIMIHRVNRVRNKESESICLDSARESLKLVDSAVSSAPNSPERRVIAWLFMYLPFTPFFTIFINVIRNPQAKSSEDDIQLMQAVADYLTELQAVKPGAVRLLKVASGFLQVAQAFVRTQGVRSGGNPTSSNATSAQVAQTPSEPSPAQPLQKRKYDVLEEERAKQHNYEKNENTPTPDKKRKSQPQSESIEMFRDRVSMRAPISPQSPPPRATPQIQHRPQQKPHPPHPPQPHRSQTYPGPRAAAGLPSPTWVPSGAFASAILPPTHQQQQQFQQYQQQQQQQQHQTPQPGQQQQQQEYNHHHHHHHHNQHNHDYPNQEQQDTPGSPQIPLPTAFGVFPETYASMAEPQNLQGFQHQMEEAIKAGPLDFDWFSWDQFLGSDPATASNIPFAAAVAGLAPDGTQINSFASGFGGAAANGYTSDSVGEANNLDERR